MVYRETFFANPAASSSKSSPFLTGSTNNGNRHRVRLLLGGKTPGGLPENSQKVKKEEASIGL